MKNLFIIFLLFSFSSFAQKKEENSKKKESYKSIIDTDAITDEGLFKVHKKGGDYYYEIHPEILNKEN